MSYICGDCKEFEPIYDRCPNCGLELCEDCYFDHLEDHNPQVFNKKDNS